MSSRENGRGKILAHITTAHQEEWLINRSEKNGFKLADEEWLVTESRWYIFKKNKEQKNKVKLLSVTYEGILTVTDADAFRNALVNGIGREKAYGLGLMTIVGVRK
jgi:CRISPR system Cascade subunit CasE